MLQRLLETCVGFIAYIKDAHNVRKFSLQLFFSAADSVRCCHRDVFQVPRLGIFRLQSWNLEGKNNVILRSRLMRELAKPSEVDRLAAEFGLENIELSS